MTHEPIKFDAARRKNRPTKPAGPIDHEAIAKASLTEMRRLSLTLFSAKAYAEKAAATGDYAALIAFLRNAKT